MLILSTGWRQATRHLHIKAEDTVLFTEKTNPLLAVKFIFNVNRVDGGDVT
jgi:hypothetical protein